MVEALRDAGHWAEIVDRDWRRRYMTDDLRFSYGGLLEHASPPLGAHYFGAGTIEARLGWRSGANTLDAIRVMLVGVGAWTLADTTGGREQLREIVASALGDTVAEFSPVEGRLASSFVVVGFGVGAKPLETPVIAVRVHDDAGRLAGTELICVPDDTWGEAVKAVVVPADGEAPAADELIALVKQHKGSVLAPKTVDFVEAIPLTSVGKHDKKALRPSYWQDRVRDVN